MSNDGYGMVWYSTQEYAIDSTFSFIRIIKWTTWLCLYGHDGLLAWMKNARKQNNKRERAAAAANETPNHYFSLDEETSAVHLDAELDCNQSLADSKRCSYQRSSSREARH